MRLLLLGGTGEARALAARLHPRVDLISSLAGRVPDPALPVGPVRVGGFGGAAGLRNWLGDNGIGAVVDATHPFAATITANAAAACAELGLPHLVLYRPLLTIPMTTGFTAAERDLMHQLPSMPQVKDGACLGFFLFAGAVVAAGNNVQGYLETSWG